MRGLADSAFQGVFQRLFVYNILFEDSEVDERFLGIDPTSTVLGISGAGCRVAGHLCQSPRSIDAVDINPHHLALTALKVEAARSLGSYDELFELFGQGSAPGARRVLDGLAARLPDPMRRHVVRHRGLFANGLLVSGLTAKFLRVLRRMAGVDEAWLRRLSSLDVEARRRRIKETFEPVFRRPWVKFWLESPVHLLSLGVNFAQCERMLRMEGAPDLAAFLLMHLERVAATDVARNWFAWYAIVGRYNRDDQEALPPFLRRDRHERALRSDTRVEYHHRNIFDVMDRAPDKTWSHFTLCDAPDWMSDAAQRRLFESVLRTGRDGAVLQYRTVERGSLVDRHGLSSRLVPMVEETRLSTELDRTRQYRGVRYYRVVN